LPNTYKKDFFDVETNDNCGAGGAGQELDQLQDYSEGTIPSPKNGSPGLKNNHQ